MPYIYLVSLQSALMEKQQQQLDNLGTWLAAMEVKIPERSQIGTDLGSIQEQITQHKVLVYPEKAVLTEDTKLSTIRSRLEAQPVYSRVKFEAVPVSSKKKFKTLIMCSMEKLEALPMSIFT